MSNIIIQPINIEDVIKYDKDKYNSNNHWTNDIPPKDYLERLEKSKTNKWIDKFRTNYKKIIINDPNDLKWMIEASKISSKTGKFTKLYEDELNEFVKKYEHQYKSIFNGTYYFVRTENVSLKYGQHKKGPYFNLTQIIESIVSCIEGHKPLYDNTTELVIYLLEWINIRDHNEFRVFVNNNRITAISQQDLYNVYPTFDNWDKINKIIKLTVDYFETNVKDIITERSYTYDFAIIDEKFPYFIEMNSFGKEYATGSGLFHWILDEDILYGKIDENSVYFRYTVGK